MTNNKKPTMSCHGTGNITKIAKIADVILALTQTGVNWWNSMDCKEYFFQQMDQNLWVVICEKQCGLKLRHTTASKS